MSVVLDTSFLIDVLRGDAPAVQLMEELEERGEDVIIPTVVLFELWEGIERSRTPLRETDLVEEAMRGHRVTDLARDHAMRAGRVSGALARRGLVLGDADILIAGIALHEGAEVITRNEGDFARVPDLRLRTY